MCLGVDPEATITNAFKLFDKEGTGKLDEAKYVFVLYMMDLVLTIIQSSMEKA